MKIKGLKPCGLMPEKVKTKEGKLIETGEQIKMFKAPDGYKATYEKFYEEACRGRLHGCIVSSSK